MALFAGTSMDNHCLKNQEEIHIQKNRPLLSASSIKTYVSLLKNLHVDDYNNFDAINAKLNVRPLTGQKTAYAALYALTDNIKYKKLLTELSKQINVMTEKQIQSKTQEENYVNTDERDATYDKLKSLFDTDPSTDKKQDYIIYALTSGKHFPPRRSMDWTEFKIRNIDKKSDNYLHNGNFVFNKYKTAKHYGQQVLQCPEYIKELLERWININQGDFLLQNIVGKKLTPMSLHKRLARIHKKNAGINTFRHLYLTTHHEDFLERKRKMTEDTYKMGTSENMLVNYVKKIRNDH
jgi:hypothetical protein